MKNNGNSVNTLILRGNSGTTGCRKPRETEVNRSNIPSNAHISGTNPRKRLQISLCTEQLYRQVSGFRRVVTSSLQLIDEVLAPARPHNTLHFPRRMKAQRFPPAASGCSSGWSLAYKMAWTASTLKEVCPCTPHNISMRRSFP